MVTDWALLFFHPMFGDPQSLGRQIHHLPSFRDRGFLVTQIMVAILAADDGMNEDLIGRLQLREMMATMAFLPTGLLAAFVPQALRGAHKAIGRGRQTTVMAIFGLLPFQGLDALMQSLDQPFEGSHPLLVRLNGLDGLFESFTQGLIGLVRLVEFFVFASQRFK
jgi:hypothetical protein